jgi:E3 ubiquitin-protein ligase HECTD1
MPLSNPPLPIPGASGNLLTSNGVSWISAIPGTAPTPGITLTYASNGDTNGLFYYLGTNGGTEAWSNPYSANRINITQSSIYNSSTQPPSNLVDRTGNSISTTNIENSWVVIDLKTKKLKCNYYTVRGRGDDTTLFPRNWRLDASNDQQTWITLDTKTNQTGLNQNVYLSFPIANPGENYQYFRFMQTGFNSYGAAMYGYYLVLGEMELYGIFV